jgi:outer membrane protein assembly factor BamB
MRLRHILLGAFLASGVMSVAAPVWQFTAGGAFPGRPAVSSGNMVYAPSDDRHLYALDGTTGSMIWRAYLGDRPNGTITVSPDGTILVGTRRRTLVAVNPRGRIIWHTSLSGEVIGDPAVGADGTIRIALSDATLVSVSHLGVMRSRTQFVAAPSAGPSILSNGTTIYHSTDESIYAVDVNGVLLWQAVLAGVPASACVDSTDRLIVGTDYGSIVAVSPDGSILWDLLSSEAFLPPVLLHGAIFCADEGGTITRIGSDGEISWQHATGIRLRHTIAVDARETVIAETVDGRLLRCNSGGPIGRPTEYAVSSTGFVLTHSGALFAGGSDWRVYAFAVGTAPGDDWSQYGRDQHHSASVDRNTSRQIRRDDFADRSEFAYLNALLSSRNRMTLERALSAVADALEEGGGDAGSARYHRWFLEELSVEGLARVESNSFRTTNNYPDIRIAALELLPAVADIKTNSRIAAIISSERDEYVISAAMRAAGLVGSDPDGEATRAVAAKALEFLVSPTGASERVLFAALAAMSGIIAYHGGPRDESGLTLLLSLYRAESIPPLRQGALEVIRSIRYY